MATRPGISKRHPAAAEILRRWRDLTGGPAVRDEQRRTLVACSGGPDSVALAATLAGAGGADCIAHILHDLRPPAETRADRDIAAAVARSLGLPFVESAVHVASLSGNPENNARRARYAALRDLAASRGVRVLATAHHADDQLETLLMRIGRGTSPAGFVGIASSRVLGHARLIRPCLSVTRNDLHDIVREVGLPTATDASNADLRLARNAVRARAAAALREIFPRAATHASQLAEQMRAVGSLLKTSALALLANARRPDGTLDRSPLRDAPQLLRTAAIRAEIALATGDRRLDDLHARSLAPLSRAIADHDGSERRFSIAGAHILLTADHLDVQKGGVPDSGL